MVIAWGLKSDESDNTKANDVREQPVRMQDPLGDESIAWRLVEAESQLVNDEASCWPGASEGVGKSGSGSVVLRSPPALISPSDTQSLPCWTMSKICQLRKDEGLARGGMKHDVDWRKCHR